MFCRRLPYRINILVIAPILLLITSCNGTPNQLTPTPSTSTSTPIPTFPASLVISTTFIGLEQDETPTQTTVPVENLLTLHPNFLADPRAACFIHHIDWTSTSNPFANYDNAFSCLDMNGWYVYAPGTFIKPLAAPEWAVQCPDGRIYLEIAMDDSSEIYRLNGATLVQIPSLNESVYSLTCGSGSEIWVTYSGGVGHYTGSTWIHYPPDKYLGSSKLVGDLNSIAVAPNGNVWVAAGGSIATFDGANWQVFETGKGIKEGSIPYSMDIDSNGIVWVVNNHGLLKYDGTQWSTFYEGVPDRFEYYSKIIKVDKENRIWVAREYPASIDMYDPQTKRWVVEIGEEALKVNLIKAMQFDRQDRLWFVTDYGLDIYDGSVLTTYHMDTADLYANTADAMIILGDGPRLPALAQKAPGSIHGKLINPDPTKYTGRQVEICIKAAIGVYYGATPCADQAYHALTTVDADGNFEFKDIPVGKYYLTIQEPSNSWRGTGQIEVNPGTETELGEIKFPSE